MRALLVVIAIITLVAACGEKKDTSDAQQTQQEVDIDTVLQHRLMALPEAPRPSGVMAFHVFDLTANKSVFGYQDTLALPSASCMKLLTGITALRLLGKDYHYWNAIFMRGKTDKDGTLHGDLGFKAMLDPQLVPEELDTYAAAVKRKGVKRLDGKLYVDLLLNEPVTAEEHWYPWDLSFARYGMLYKGAPYVVKQLKAALRAKGIAVRDSQVILARVPHHSRCLYVGRRQIDTIIQRMWKNSSNTQSTSLLYTIGHHAAPKQHPVTAGVEVLRTFLRDSLQCTSPQLTIHDGCGLCTHNRLSPQALTTLLRYGYQDEHIRASLMRNLAIAGTDGTLMRELTSPLTRGKVFAKTGTLSHPYGISTLAGFCTSPDGHTLTFAIMASEMSVLDARVLQRKLCETMMKPTSTKNKKGAKR